MSERNATVLHPRRSRWFAIRFHTWDRGGPRADNADERNFFHGNHFVQRHGLGHLSKMGFGMHHQRWFMNLESITELRRRPVLLFQQACRRSQVSRP
jgi:hypothetical protein